MVTVAVIAGAVVFTAVLFGVWLRWDSRHDRYLPRRRDPFAHDDDDLQERLRASLRAAAGDVEPGPGGLEAIQARLGHQSYSWPELRDRFAALFPGWRP